MCVYMCKGTTYDGDYVEGKRHGKGILTTGLKDLIYDGDWKEDERTGFGTCVLNGSDSYVGQWLRGSFQGQGKYCGAQGDIYEGEFNAGLRHGVGTMTRPKPATTTAIGSKATTAASGGEPGAGAGMGHGSEEDEGDDGGMSGDFMGGPSSPSSSGASSGGSDGWGTVAIQEQQQEQQHEHENEEDDDDVLVLGLGHGLYEGVDDGELLDPLWVKYVGEWVEGRRHGLGTCTWCDGRLYSGQWCNDEPHGEGRSLGRRGEEYEGEYLEGLRHGEGSLRFHLTPKDPSGTGSNTGSNAGTLKGLKGMSSEREGRWERGRPVTGEWRLRWPNGDSFVGEVRPAPFSFSPFLRCFI